MYYNTKGREADNIKPVIYIDVLFLVNFFMDGILLYATAYIMRLRCCMWRIVLSAAISALSAVFMFFADTGIFAGAVCRAAQSVLMLLVAFGRGSIYVYLKRLGVFYLMSAAMAGVCTALFFGYGSSLNALISNGVVYFNIPVYLLMLSAAVTLGATKGVLHLLRKNSVYAAQTASIKLKWRGAVCTVSGYGDTGNGLFDPISHLPVLLCSYETIKPLLPYEAVMLYESTKVTLKDIENTPFSFPIRLIPYKPVGGEGGLLVGFTPDKAEYRGKEVKIIVGILKAQLPLDTEHDAIFNPQMI